MRFPTRFLILPVVIFPLLLLAAAGCGSDQDVATDESTSTTAAGSTTTPPSTATGSGRVLPTGADEVVFRIAAGGGFVPVEYNLASVPALSIMGDGSVIVSGPVTAQYPPHALPNLLAGSAEPAAVAALVAKADELGLLTDAPIDFGTPGITDLDTTTVTVVADGKTYELSAYAFSTAAAAGATGLTAEQDALRKDLAELVSAAQDLASDASDPYEATAVTVYALPVLDGVEGGVAPGKAVWPLDDPAAWTPSPATEGCKTYSGTEAASALAAAAEAAQTTEWSSEGSSTPVRLVFRPLLPDETDLCSA